MCKDQANNFSNNYKKTLLPTASVCHPDYRVSVCIMPNASLVTIKYVPWKATGVVEGPSYPTSVVFLARNPNPESLAIYSCKPHSAHPRERLSFFGGQILFISFSRCSWKKVPRDVRPPDFTSHLSIKIRDITNSVNVAAATLSRLQNVTFASPRIGLHTAPRNSTLRVAIITAKQKSACECHFRQQAQSFVITAGNSKPIVPS